MSKMSNYIQKGSEICGRRNEINDPLKKYLKCQKLMQKFSHLQSS